MTRSALDSGFQGAFGNFLQCEYIRPLALTLALARCMGPNMLSSSSNAIATFLQPPKTNPERNGKVFRWLIKKRYSRFLDSLHNLLPF